MKQKIEIDYKELEEKLISYISNLVGQRNVVVGLSGGIDSSIVCALAVKALGIERVKAIIVKNSRYPAQNLQISRDYAKGLGVQIQEIDSTGIREGAFRSLDFKQDNLLVSATLDARICDLIIKTVAGLEDRIYLGTINGTERLTGWYPKGNLVGDFAPIGGLLKSQEKKLAEHMGLGYLVETISEDSARICSGCGELPEFKGIPYSTLDEVLYIYETSKGDNLARRLRESGIDRAVYMKIIGRILLVDHKNDVFPNYCKINLSEDESK
ncbi:MAG: NAD(+) synthase [archaeon]